MPKYWLDGIFDEEKVEEIVKVKVEEIDFICEKYTKSKVGYFYKLGDKGYGYYRITNTDFIGYSPIKMVLCKNFKYCSNPKCCNRHWYNVLPCYSERMNELKTNPEYCKNDEIQALDRAIVRFKRQGYSVIVK